MSAGAYDLSLRQGETWQRKVQWYDSSGSPVALTGYSAMMEVRPFPGHSGTALLTAATNPAPGGGAGDGRITIASDGFSLTILIPKSVTAALTPWDAAVYDLWVVDGSGNYWPLLKGNFAFEKRITLVP